MLNPISNKHFELKIPELGMESLISSVFLTSLCWRLKCHALHHITGIDWICRGTQTVAIS